MSYRIVVADKDGRSQEAVTRFLGEAENELVGVSTSGALKNAIKTRKPDLIILNSMLEDVPGWRLVKRIKESRDYNDVPVLLMTGDPEGPTQAEAKTAGADGYLSKPIQGQTLKSAVNSLLGIQEPPATVDEDELTIEFEDDSGEMTEELLALSNAEIDVDDSPTDVGDTVEIDTGTLVSELEPASTDGISGETYGDTVKLNLDDMQLETEVEEGTSFEPTIELVSDIPQEIESAGVSFSEPVAIEEPSLPDFSSVTRDQRQSEKTARDSVTIDMSMVDSGLEIESDSEFSFTPSGAAKSDTLEQGYTDIEKILEVQDPTRVLTSDDLLLHDDSLIKSAVSQAELDQIDIVELEEDPAIREMDLEELEGIESEDEASLGLDLEETVPVASIDMEEIANEDLSGMIDLEYEEESSLDIDIDAGPPALAASEAQAPEELTLEEVPYEEVTTQEFFGEELPTEEFPAEKFPEDKTGTVDLERQFVFDKAADFSGGPDAHELTLDTEAGEEILFSNDGEDEPALEVTEDISLEEITLDEGPSLERPPSVYEIPLPQEPITQVTEPVRAAVEDHGAVKTAPAVEAHPVAEARQTRPSLTEPKPGAPKDREPSVSEIAGIVSSILSEKLKEPPAGKLGLVDSAVAPAAELALPDQRQFTEEFQKALKASLPSRQELLEGVTLGISKTFPTREEIFERVDLTIRGHLPSDQAMAERVDLAVKAALPSPAAVTEKLEKAISELHSTEIMTKGFEQAFGKFLPAASIAERVEKALEAIPADVEISQRLDRAIGALPSPETFLNIVDQAVRGIASPEELSKRLSDALAPLLSPETLSARFERALQAVPYQEVVKQSIDEALGKAISSEMVVERLDQALRGIPSQEYIRLRLDHAFAALPTSDMINQRIDIALQAVPSKNELRARFDEAFAGLPSAQVIMERVDTALETVPSRPEIMEAVEQALQCLPSPEAVVSLVNRRLEASIPSKDELGSEMRAIMEKRIQSAISVADIQEAMSRLLPDTDQILKIIRDALPGRERFQETLASSIAEAVQGSLPERMWIERISRSLFDEKTRGMLPERDEIVAMLREEIQSKALDMVERIIRQEIDRITAGPSAK